MACAIPHCDGSETEPTLTVCSQGHRMHESCVASLLRFEAAPRCPLCRQTDLSQLRAFFDAESRFDVARFRELFRANPYQHQRPDEPDPPPPPDPESESESEEDDDGWECTGVFVRYWHPERAEVRMENVSLYIEGFMIQQMAHAAAAAAASAAGSRGTLRYRPHQRHLPSAAFRVA